MRVTTNIVFVVVAIVVLWKLYRFFNPLPTVVATFDSPTGTHRLVMTETRPPGFMQSPYVYHLNVVDAAGRPLTGKALEIDHDSAVMDPASAKVHWSPDAVTVAWYSRRSTTTFGDGRQTWSDLPSEFPTPRGD
jgi:hypothetical protein